MEETPRATPDATPTDDSELRSQQSAAARPSRDGIPSRSDKEAYAAWLKQLEAPDRSNCRA